MSKLFAVRFRIFVYKSSKTTSLFVFFVIWMCWSASSLNLNNYAWCVYANDGISPRFVTNKNGTINSQRLFSPFYSSSSFFFMTRKQKLILKVLKNKTKKVKLFFFWIIQNTNIALVCLFKQFSNGAIYIFNLVIIVYW